MLSTKTKVYSLLTNDSPLIVLVGTTDQITFEFPNEIITTPLIVFYEADQNTPGMVYFDDAPIAARSVFEMHVFTDISQSTTSIVSALDRIMQAALWNQDSSADAPDASVKFNHRVIRYSRVLMPEEIT